MFMGPLDAVKPWQSAQIQGVVRFRDRVYAVCTRPLVDAMGDETRRLMHKTIQKVGHDIEALAFNTAISAMMVYTNHLSSLPELPREAAEALVLLISPFAPHLAEELWSKLGHTESLALHPWPSFDAALTIDDEIELPVQVNGKVRDKLRMAREASEAQVREAALAADGVKAFVGDKPLKKLVYVPGRIVNIVV
jgi:leucyl-tRNA synthetase